MTINEQAQAAITALNALNDFTAAWNASVKSNGYAAAFRECTRMADHLHIELLEAIIAFDDDALGTLDELRLHDQPEADDYDGGRYDFVTSRGLVA